MATFTQETRQMGVNTPLGSDELLLRSMSATERIGRLFSYELELLSTNPDIAFDDIVGHQVTVWLTRAEGGERRFFNGYVSRFVLAGNDDESRTIYRAVLVPWLWLLTRTSNCRIFQEMTVPDIIKQVFRDTGFTDFEDHLDGSYRTWDYCVQYRETDFNFVSRLMEQEGIYYYFTHEDGRHVLHLGDSVAAHEAAPGNETVPYRTPGRGAVVEEHISSWTYEQRIQPGAYALRDYNFETPRADLTANLNNPASHPQASFEIYDYPGEYLSTQDGNTYVRVRLEEQQAEQQVADGRTTARGLFPGSTFELSEFPRGDQNKEYLVIAASYELYQSGYGSGEGDGESRFSCAVRCIDLQRPYRLARNTPKPVIQGPQTAEVVGPSGDEIYTDQHGRVTVQFHWDREGKRDENSSCWVRVSQLWAGKNWGAIAIPRIGHEVIVEFMEGDPDRPIITGRVYNGDNTVPYDLPGNMTQTGLKSRSSKGGSGDNFNEIRFEDLKGSEEMYIHAERDQNSVVENDQTIEVGHDRKETIGRDRELTVGNNKKETVGKDKTVDIAEKHMETIGKDMSLSVSGNRNMTIGKDLKENVSGKMTVQVGKDNETTIEGQMKISVAKDMTTAVDKTKSVQVTKEYTITAKKLSITADDEISLKTGSATITMKKNGDITIKGKKITVKGSGDVIIKGSKIAEN